MDSLGFEGIGELGTDGCRRVSGEPTASNFTVALVGEASPQDRLQVGRQRRLRPGVRLKATSAARLGHVNCLVSLISVNVPVDALKLTVNSRPLASVHSQVETALAHFG